MNPILFYIFAGLTLLAAFGTTISRNPVNAALSMIVSLLSMAALFVGLETYFLAILQVLVYAGAIVVLFLFIIMLIDAEKAPAPSLISYIASLAAFGLMASGIFTLVGSHAGEFAQAQAIAPAATVRAFGVELFARYQLPLQITGFMLLAAMIGVILISKKLPATPANGDQKL